MLHVGQGEACGHVCALLYTLALWKGQGKTAVPTDVAKTSLPQTWHMPRGAKITPTTADSVEVCNRLDWIGFV